MPRRYLSPRLQRVRDNKVTESPSNRLKDHLDRLRDSANEASQLARKVYLSFLLFSVYIAILVGSTTDEQLLRGTAAKVPVLNVELPIVGTYLVVPLMFLFFHLNLLILLYLLSQKLYAFEGHIEKLPPDQQAVEQRLLYPFPFSQMLVGKYRARLDQLLLAIMVKSTLIVFPIALLLWAQVRFIPYHSILITWIHRAVVLADLLLLLVLWPKIRSPNGHWFNWLGSTSKHRPVWKRIALPISRICVLGTLSLVVLILSLSIATIPDEWIEKRIGWQDLTEILFGKIEIQPGIKARKTPFHRHLILRELTLVREAPPPELLATYARMEKQADSAWLDHAKGLNLGGRDLRFADFFYANLTKIDLREAKLQGADLRGAKLQGADLRKSKIGGTDFNEASLDLSDLREVNCTPLTPDDWQKLTEELKKTIPEGNRRSFALQRLEKAEKRKKTTFPPVKNAKNVLYNHPNSCHEWPVTYLAQSDYDRELTQFLFDLACTNKYMAKGIAPRVYALSRNEPERTIWPKLAKKLVDSDCEAVQQLPKDTLEELKKTATKAQKPNPPTWLNPS
jgi:hypothetical protein